MNKKDFHLIDKYFDENKIAKSSGSRFSSVVWISWMGRSRGNRALLPLALLLTSGAMNSSDCHWDSKFGIVWTSLGE